MQQGTVSSADRLSQGVIAWPQVRRIPLKTSKKSRKKEKSRKSRRLRRAVGPHLPPAWVPSRAPAPPQRRRGERERVRLFGESRAARDMPIWPARGPTTTPLGAHARNRQARPRACSALLAAAHKCPWCTMGASSCQIYRSRTHITTGDNTHPPTLPISRHPLELFYRRAHSCGRARDVHTLSIASEFSS